MTSFSVLTSAEAVSTAEAIETLRPLSWTGALLERAGEHGGLTDRLESISLGWRLWARLLDVDRRGRWPLPRCV